MPKVPRMKSNILMPKMKPIGSKPTTADELFVTLTPLYQIDTNGIRCLVEPTQTYSVQVDLYYEDCELNYNSVRIEVQGILPLPDLSREIKNAISDEIKSLRQVYKFEGDHTGCELCNVQVK